jgi:hypothetical protein
VVAGCLCRLTAPSRGGTERRRSGHRTLRPSAARRSRRPGAMSRSARRCHPAALASAPAVGCAPTTPDAVQGGGLSSQGPLTHNLTHKTANGGVIRWTRADGVISDCLRGGLLCTLVEEPGGTLNPRAEGSNPSWLTRSFAFSFPILARARVTDENERAPPLSSVLEREGIQCRSAPNAMPTCRSAPTP